MPGKAILRFEADTKFVRDMMGRFRDNIPIETAELSKKVSKIYAKEIQTMARRVLKKPFARGVLAESIKSIPIDPENGVYGITAAKNIKGQIYAWYAELGRGPGKAPPFSPQFAHWADIWWQTKYGEYKPGVIPYRVLQNIIRKYGTKRHPQGRFIRPGIKIAHGKAKAAIDRHIRGFVRSKGRKT